MSWELHKVKEPKTRKRAKLVFNNDELVKVFVHQKYQKGRNRTRTMLFEGKRFYAGDDVDKFEISRLMTGFVWVHPLSAQLKYAPGLEHYNPESEEMERWEEVRVHGAWERKIRKDVFVVPHIPASTHEHLQNVEYLWAKVESETEFRRLRSSWSINRRKSEFDLNIKRLKNYCEFFGLEMPNIDESEAVSKATARLTYLTMTGKR